MNRLTARAAHICACALLSTLSTTGPGVAASRWERVGPETGALEVVAFAPGSSTHAVAAGYGGVFRTTDGGATWTLVADLFANGAQALAYDPSDAQRVYLVGNTGAPAAGVHVSTDGGSTFTQRISGFDTANEPYLSSLAVSADGSRVYAGGGNRGVFVSTDDGLTWSVGNTGLPSSSGRFESIEALAVDPGNPLVVYAAPSLQGVYKSVDGGVTWTAVNTGLGNLYVKGLAISPANGQTVYATVGGGVYKTTNGGASWTAAGYSAADAGPIAIDPDNSQHLVTGTLGGAMFRSTDGGANWAEISTGLRTGFVEAVSLAGAGSTRVLAVGRLSAGLSSDQGSTWTEPVGLRTADLVGLVQHPTNATLVYAATESGFFRSTDGGASFARYGSGLVGKPTVLAMHPTDPATLYLGLQNNTQITDDTLFRSQDGGATWAPLSSVALTDREVHALAIAPSNPSVMYLTGTRVVGITVSRATLRSIDGGVNWTTIDNGLPVYPAFFDPKALVVSATDPNTVVLGSYDGGYRTTDGGASWSEIAALQDGNHDSMSVTVEMLARGPDGTLYAGGQGNYGLKRSTDGGATWSNSLINGVSVVALAIHPDDPQRLLAGVLGDGLRESSDGGTTWTELEAPDAAPNAFLTAKPVLYDHATMRLFAGIAYRGLQVLALESDLSVEMTQFTSSPLDLGGTLTGTALVSNQGPDLATAVEVTVALDATLTGASVTLSGAACPITNNTATCSLASLGVSESRTLSLSATAGAAGLRGVTITASSANADLDTGDDSATRSVTVRPRADLSIGLTAPANFPVTGSSAIVTATLANAGPQTATAITSTFTLPFGASFQGASGATCAAVGSTVTCATDSLAAGATRGVDLSIVFTVPASNTVTATISADVTDPDATDDSASLAITVRGRADLRMRFSAPSPAEITSGQRATYDSVLTNLGPDPASSIAVNFVLPSGASSVAAGGADCTQSGVTLGCSIMTLGSGSSVAIPVAMNLSTTGTMTLSASANAAEVDPDTGNNADSSSVGVSRPTTGADLTVAVTGGAASLQVNKTTTYSYSVTNTGPEATTSSTFSFSVPALLTGSSITAEKGMKCTKGTVMRCTLGALTVGRTVRGTIKLKAKKTPGTATMTATVTGSPADFDTTNNTVTRSLTITPKN